MITITGIRFNNELRTAQNLNFLLACIGEKVKVELDFSFEDVVFANIDDNLVLKPNPADVDLVNTDGVLWSKDGVSFAEYRVGDTVGVYNGSTFDFYTILVKYNNGLIRTTYAGAQFTYDGQYDEYFFNATPIAGIRYAFNLLNVGETFNSLVDGEYQQAEIATGDAANLANQDMAFTGILSYQIGNVKIKGAGGVGGTAPNYAQQNFTITHETVLTPFFLSDQFNDLVLGIKPSYYEAQNCLNYIFDLQIGKDLNNPNSMQELPPQEFEQSNTGWFNEKFNGGKTNYSITSLVLKKGADVVNALEFDTDITVEITIANPTNSPFSNNNTKFIFGFNYLPEEESFYQNNGRNMTQNFLFDSKMNTVGSAAANGDNFGTGMQIIKTVAATFISTSSIKVTAVIRVGSDAKAILQEGDFSRYMMWVITENHALAAAISDKVNLLAQVSEFELNLTDIDLVDGDTVFITHPFSQPSDGEPSLEMFPVDDVAAHTKFSIDFTGKTTDGIVIKKIIPKIVLQHATEADIILEQQEIDVSGYPLIAGLVQDINFSQDRVFKIPSEIRKTITIDREFDLDSGNTYNWALNYPFMCRWEYWEQLVVNNAPAGIFDPGQPLNGLNHYWNRLRNVPGWTLWYIVNMQIEQNGVLFEQDVTLNQLQTNQFDGTYIWENETIKSFDPDTDDELVSGANKYLLGFKETRIEASFEKASGPVPNLADVVIVIWIETYEAGGISGIRRISSAYELDGQSWFKSIDSSNKVVVTQDGAVFTGTCLVDHSKLPTNARYSIYARIYDKTGVCSGIADEDGICILDEDGVMIEPD